jgi:hypothetical protein
MEAEDRAGIPTTRAVMTMNRYVLRGILGMFAGLVSSVVLAGALGSGLLAVALGTTVGLAYGLTVGQHAGGYLDSGMAAAALGVPLWAVVSVILLPLTAGENRTGRRRGCASHSRPSWAGFCTALVSG